MITDTLVEVVPTIPTHEQAVHLRRTCLFQQRAFARYALHLQIMPDLSALHSL
jgi:hypothetical protein